ncbi:MAG: O-antigen ligase family protein [Blautia massiliensis (ex Durand et al. 2017)]|uniref:O-antigen ligase family protein n=1 Tax=Blautia massiliensis (ex Durand et al. 2017) TaxID=1737424 RepID=UPI003991AC2B
MGAIFLLILDKTEIGQYAFYNNTSTILERLERWKISIDYFWKYPLFGAGYLIQNADYNPHNWIVAVISRGGIVGVILAIMIITVLINRFRGEYDNDIVRGKRMFCNINVDSRISRNCTLLLVHMIFLWFILE